MTLIVYCRSHKRHGYELTKDAFPGVAGDATYNVEMNPVRSVWRGGCRWAKHKATLRFRGRNVSWYVHSKSGAGPSVTDAMRALFGVCSDGELRADEYFVGVRCEGDRRAHEQFVYAWHVRRRLGIVLGGDDAARLLNVLRKTYAEAHSAAIAKPRVAEVDEGRWRDMVIEPEPMSVWIRSGRSSQQLVPLSAIAPSVSAASEWLLRRCGDMRSEQHCIVRYEGDSNTVYIARGDTPSRNQPAARRSPGTHREK